MKIIIATGVFPPDIGGPAPYIEKLAKSFKKKGIEVAVLTYSDHRNSQVYDFPVIRVCRGRFFLWRYFQYFRKLRFLAKDAQIIYAFDLLSSGLPSALVKKFSKKKLLIRLSGDFIWEKSVQQGLTQSPLRLFYSQKKSFKEKLSIYLVQRVFNQVDRFIFTTDFFRNILLKAYQIPKEKISIIANPFPERKLTNVYQVEQRIIFAGRFIKLKNIDLLIKAFQQVVNKQNNLKLEIIGQGPEEKNLRKLVRDLKLENKVIFKQKVSYQKLVKEIAQSLFVVLPSLSEVSPNLVLECIKLKKPIILTKATGFYERFKDDLIFIDTFNQKDLENKIIYLLNKDNYQKYQNKISLISTEYSWPVVVSQHIDIFNQIIR